MLYHFVLETKAEHYFPLPDQLYFAVPDRDCQQRRAANFSWVTKITELLEAVCVRCVDEKAAIVDDRLPCIEE
jgi:hypothetical protein